MRRLVFDINDFDETTTGPWECDNVQAMGQLTTEVDPAQTGV